MCGSSPPPPQVAPKIPVASDPNVTDAQANAGVGQASDTNLANRKSLNIDLSSAGSSGSGLNIPQ